MLSLEREFAALRENGRLGAGRARSLIAIERREILSLYYELRVLLYVAVTLIVTGVGLYLKRNLDRIGPTALIAGIAAVAAACYAFVLVRRSRPTVAHDYLLLLGALLVSADLGYAEAQYHLLDARWSWHLLLLAIFHAATAYVFASRVLLSVSIASLAGFLGIQTGVAFNLYAGPELAARMFLCAAILLAWRFAQIGAAARGSFGGRHAAFIDVFHHAIAILALAASLVLAFDVRTRLAGIVVTVVCAGAAIAFGWRRSEFAFLVYGTVAALIGLGNVVEEVFHNEALTRIYFLIATIAAIVFLFRAWRRLKEDR
jgi:hypothetical protein